MAIFQRVYKPIFKIIAALFVLLLTTIIALLTYWHNLQQNPEGRLHPMLVKPAFVDVAGDRDIYARKGIVAIGGREFEMPLAYVGSGGFKDGRKEDSVYLTYMLPDFKSQAEYQNREQRRKMLTEGYFGGMLLEAAADRPSLDKMLGNLRHGMAKEEPVASEYGLESFNWYYNSPEGLYRYSTMHIEKDKQGKVIGFIECTAKERGAHVVNPQCSHKFIDKKLLYDISYTKKRYFPDWKAQKEAAIRFIDHFEN